MSSASSLVTSSSPLTSAKRRSISSYSSKPIEYLKTIIASFDVISPSSSTSPRIPIDTDGDIGSGAGTGSSVGVGLGIGLSSFLGLSPVSVGDGVSFRVFGDLHNNSTNLDVHHMDICFNIKCKEHSEFSRCALRGIYAFRRTLI